jgi:hypothetical protein
MPTSAIASFVFVDFENVPHVDFAALKDERVKVTLLIGQKNKLTPTQVEQISRLPFEFRVIKVGAIKKNALDFALTFHLGETVSRNPNGRFYIVSGDKNDFDPLVSHLKANHVRISRHGSIAELPLLTPVKRPTKPPFREQNKHA